MENKLEDYPYAICINNDNSLYVKYFTDVDSAVDYSQYLINRFELKKATVYYGDDTFYKEIII